LNFRAIKSVASGVSNLVSAANKAMQAINCRRAFLHMCVSEFKQRCNFFDSMVLPILDYACEVWAVDKAVGKPAEQLHKQFRKMYLALEATLQTSSFYLWLHAIYQASL